MYVACFVKTHIVILSKMQVACFIKTFIELFRYIGSKRKYICFLSRRSDVRHANYII